MCKYNFATLLLLGLVIGKLVKYIDSGRMTAHKLHFISIYTIAHVMICPCLLKWSSLSPPPTPPLPFPPCVPWVYGERGIHSSGGEEGWDVLLGIVPLESEES